MLAVARRQPLSCAGRVGPNLLVASSLAEQLVCAQACMLLEGLQSGQPKLGVSTRHSRQAAAADVSGRDGWPTEAQLHINGCSCTAPGPSGQQSASGCGQRQPRSETSDGQAQQAAAIEASSRGRQPVAEHLDSHDCSCTPAGHGDQQAASDCSPKQPDLRCAAQPQAELPVQGSQMGCMSRPSASKLNP